jgi:hypothetical protein
MAMFVRGEAQTYHRRAPFRPATTVPEKLTPAALRKWRLGEVGKHLDDERRTGCRELLVYLAATIGVSRRTYVRYRAVVKRLRSQARPEDN